MIFDRRKKKKHNNFIDKLVERKRENLLSDAFKGKTKQRLWIQEKLNSNRKANKKYNKISNLVQSIKDPKQIKENIENTIDKSTINNRILASEVNLRSLENVNRAKQLGDINIKGFFRRSKSGKVSNVRGHKKKMLLNLKLPDKVSTIDKDSFNNLKLVNASAIASANLTKIVTDGRNKYIMKAANDWPVQEQIANKLGFNYNRKVGLATSEALFSDIGKNLGINVQETVLVPQGMKNSFSDGKNPFTMHKFVNGMETLQAVKLGILDEKFAKSLKISPVEDRRTGNYYGWGSKVRTMTQHKDLSKIFAMDVVFSNYDRHQNNLFYNPVKNSFTGIDHGESLTVPVDFGGLKNSIGSNYKNLNQQQKQNFGSFKSTLKDIVENYKPEVVKTKLDTYSNQLTPNVSSIERAQVNANMQRKALVYQYNYLQTKDMLNWMDKNNM